MSITTYNTNEYIHISMQDFPLNIIWAERVLSACAILCNIMFIFLDTYITVMIFVIISMTFFMHTCPHQYEYIYIYKNVYIYMYCLLPVAFRLFHVA